MSDTENINNAPEPYNEAHIPQQFYNVKNTMAKIIESKKYPIKILEETAKKIPKENFISPEPRIVIPAIQEMSLIHGHDNEEVKKMFENLLTSSMDKNKKSEVHPAFVDMIRQLIPDEARILRYITKQQNYVPLLDVYLKLKDVDGRILQVTNILNFEEIEGLEGKDEIPAMIANLQRLLLIEIPAGEHITDDNIYNNLISMPIVKYWLSQTNPNGKYEYEKKYLRLTEWGRAFCKICIPVKETDTYILKKFDNNIQITANEIEWEENN